MQRLVALTQGLLLGWGRAGVGVLGEGAAWWQMGLTLAGGLGVGVGRAVTPRG